MLRFLVFFALLASSLGGLLKFSLFSSKGRIMGGTEVDAEDVPYQLSLMSGTNHICGAAIISEYWALTSASCLTGLKATSVRLRAGSSVLGSGGTVHSAAELFVHEGWNSYTIDNDIAAIKVVEPFDLSGGLLKAVPLAEKTPEAGTTLTISGWGQSSAAGGATGHLKAITIPVYPQASCRGMFGWWISITEHMLCGKAADGTDAPCMGDYGGPVVANGELVGLVSFVMGCGLYNYPEVNVDVASEREWIRATTGV